MRPNQRHLLSFGAALALIVAGCGATPPTTAPASSSAASPSAAAAVSAAPSELATSSPSAAAAVTPTSVLLRIGQPSFTLVADVDGTVTANGVSFPLSGHVEYGGGDSSSLVVISLPNGDERTESVTVGGTTWTRSAENGPWVEQPKTATSASRGSIGGMVAALSSLEDDGTATFHGAPAHRFVTPAGKLAATDLGLTSPGITGFTASLGLLADDSSNLVGMTIDASWKQASASGSIPATMKMDFVLRDAKPSIEKPAEPWKLFHSTRYGASVAYPAAFVARPGKGDVPDILALSTTDFAILAREPQPRGASLEGYVRAYENSTKKASRVTPEHRVDGAMGSLPAVFLTYHIKVNGATEYLVVGLTMKGSNGYFVALTTVPGNESNANAVFDAMMSTFQVDG